jgi:hypothetical protein
VNEYFITTSSFFKGIGLNQKKFGPKIVIANGLPTG